MDGFDFATILPVLIITVWACVLLLVDLLIPKRREAITAQLAVVGMLAALVVSLLQFGEQAITADGMIIKDGYSSFLQIIFLFSGIIGTVQAHDYLKRRDIMRGEYYVLILFAISGMMFMAQAADLMMVFISLELLSLPLYVLSGFASPEQKSEESALKYFLLGAFASGFMAFGIAMVYGGTQSTAFAGIMAAIQSGTATLSYVLIGAGMILTGLGFKIAAVPFHMWTPDVYEGAPTSVTAFMSVGAKVAGFAALLRIFLTAFPELGASWQPVAMWIAALTMAWGNVAAIGQSNIKRMLAYSSIAHAGYVLMALPAAMAVGATQDAISGALFYLLAYAITNFGAWGVVIALEKADGKGLELDDFAGLYGKRPWLAIAMLIFMLSLTGIPPMAGFMGKFYIFRTALNADLVWLALIGVTTSLISAFYYLRVVIKMFMVPGEPETRSNGWLNATIWLTAIATLLLGLFPGPALELVNIAGMLIP